MQAPAEALDLTASYVRICGSGIFFIVAYNMLSALFRGLGDSRSPLIFVLVACIVNFIGDLVLVAGFHLDAAGAAIATVAAQAVSVICAIAMLLKKELPFKIHRSDFKLNPQCKKFLGIGLPLALQEFLTQLSFLALCAFVNRLGLEASSGYGVACKIVNFAMLIPSSLMQSMASFVSQNVGAGNKKRAEQSMFTGIGIGLVFGAPYLHWCGARVTFSPSVYGRCRCYCQQLRLPHGLCARDHRHCHPVQHGRLLQWQRQNALGHGTGAGADSAGASPHGVYYEYPAQRQPDDDWSVRTHLHRSGHLIKHQLFSLAQTVRKSDVRIGFEGWKACR